MNGLPKGFVVDGEAIEAGGALTPGAKGLLDFLESVPFRELTTTKQAAFKLGIHFSTVREYTTHPAFKDNKHFARINLLYLGSKQTIEALRKELAQ